MTIAATVRANRCLSPNENYCCSSLVDDRIGVLVPRLFSCKPAEQQRAILGNEDGRSRAFHSFRAMDSPGFHIKDATGTSRSSAVQGIHLPILPGDAHAGIRRCEVRQLRYRTPPSYKLKPVLQQEKVISLVLITQIRIGEVPPR